MNVKYVLEYIKRYAYAINPDYYDLHTKSSELIELENQAEYFQSVEMAYLIAKEIPGADVKKMQNIIIKKSDPSWALKFARDIQNADILKLQKIVIHSKAPAMCFEFLITVKGAEAESLIEVINNSKENSVKDKLKNYLDLANKAQFTKY